MINFELLESTADQFKTDWQNAKPFHVLSIDGFASQGSLDELVSELPNPEQCDAPRSRDYIFAKNKYERSGFAKLGVRSHELYQDLTSPRFRAWLAGLCGREVWIDEDFHGGGLHQGGAGSFLDMHVDFNVHPLHNDWFRDLNVLIYLNKDWRAAFGGSLKLVHRITRESRTIEPLFNRCVIMETRDYTLHGYDPISFPIGQYRQSIACYAYSKKAPTVRTHSTRWYPATGNAVKRVIGLWWPQLVKVKGRLFGSGTARHR